MMQIPNLVTTSWMHQGLPECIWIAAVSKESRARAGAHGPLDVLEQFVPEDESDVLDGRISRFALVPPESRAEARATLRERAPYGIPDDLGHALTQYPACPALWLYEDWDAENECDVARGISYLSELVEPMIPPRDSHSAQLRLMVIARQAKAGKLHMTRDVETAELLPKYPTYLSRDDQRKVESFVRATWNSIVNIGSDGQFEVSDWSRGFWHRSYEISECTPASSGIEPGAFEESEEEEDLSDLEESGVQNEEPSLPDLRQAFATALRQLGDDLRRQQSEAELDTFNSVTDEVKLGLASRAFRLLRNFLLTPRWWTNEMAPHLIRSLVDERIVVAWLLKRDDPEMYRAFKDYGAGKRKLYKLKLEELMDADGAEADAREDVRELHQRLEAEVNEDTMEEFLKIDLGGSFSGKNIREMAKETDLADLYSLSYQPLSTESHGEWGSLLMFDLNHCGNPLHLYHRLGSFGVEDGSYLHLGWARTATDLAEDIITDIFVSLGLDAESTFSRFHSSIRAAQDVSAPETDTPATAR